MLSLLRVLVIFASLNRVYFLLFRCVNDPITNVAVP